MKAGCFSAFKESENVPEGNVELSPSERAFAYKMKLEAVKHQGKRSDFISRQLVGKLEAADRLGKGSGESGRQVQRYIHLTELIPELLDMVDRFWKGDDLQEVIGCLLPSTEDEIHDVTRIFEMFTVMQMC